MNILIITLNLHIISNNIIICIYLAVSPFFSLYNNSIQSLNFISFQFDPYILFPYDLKLDNYFLFVWYIKFVVSTNAHLLNYSWFCKIHLILLVKKVKIARIKFNSEIKRYPSPLLFMRCIKVYFGFFLIPNFLEFIVLIINFICFAF